MKSAVSKAVLILLIVSTLAGVALSTGPPILLSEPIYPGMAPREVSDAVLEARELVIQRRYDEAEKLLWKLVEERPEDPVGATGLMVVYQVRMLENEEAFLDDEMQRVIELNNRALDRFRKNAPPNTWYYVLIGGSTGIEGIYHLWRDDYIPAGMKGFAAIQNMRKALDTDPDCWEARLGLGIFLYYRSAYASKAPFLPDSVDRREEGIREVGLGGKKRLYLDETARIALARIYFDAKQYDKSKEVADALIKQYPDFMVFHLFAARALFEASRFEEALPYYQTAYLIDLNLPFSAYRAGECLEEMGKMTEAVDWYKIAVEAGRNRSPDKWGSKAKRKLEKITSH